jgi:hypothetical protein
MVIRMGSKFGNKNMPLIRSLLDKYLDEYTHLDAQVIEDLENKIQNEINLQNGTKRVSTTDKQTKVKAHTLTNSYDYDLTSKDIYP